MLDLNTPKVIEVEMREDDTVLWVNVDGECVLRINQIAPGTITFKHSGSRWPWKPKK